MHSLSQYSLNRTFFKSNKSPVKVIYKNKYKNVGYTKSVYSHTEAANNSGSLTSRDTFQLKKEQRYSETPKLHKILTKDDIDRLHCIFKSSVEEKFSQTQLRNLLEQFNVYYIDNEFENLFLKINTNRDDFVEWDEFISYMMLGFEDDQGDKHKESLDPPIKERPIFKKSKHRHQIIRIELCQTVLSDRSVNFSQGGYVVTACDGTINYYSLDWELLRSGKSPSPSLKVAATYIMDSVCMPDVRIMCVCSTERDLRFYDTSATASNFTLRIYIKDLPEIVSTMHYYFSPNVEEFSKLTLGDNRGVIYLLEFNSAARGPFRSTGSGQPLEYQFVDIIQGRTPFIYTGFPVSHNDKVRQIAYIPSLNSILTASETKIAHSPGMLMLDLGVKKSVTSFEVSKGVTCFDYESNKEIIATGGSDSIIRLWSPYSPRKPFCFFSGHHAGICYIFLQDNGKTCYSLDKEKIIKIWDVESQSLIQTYIYLMQSLLDKSFRAFYSELTREFIVGAGELASMKCCPLLRLDLTDGMTHTRPVSIVLYNKLFEVVITCGFDSFIIVWDPWIGVRLNLIKMAHSRVLHGETLRVEITAACFDPKQKLLLTGATDGTLKVWNFNNGFCIRNMSIVPNCEVTSVLWVPDRILAVGWNKFVIEFADGVETEYPNGKTWDIQHEDEILCANACPPDTLVTTSYNGEIVFWHFETGQAYKKFNVKDPFTPIHITYGGKSTNSDLPKDLKALLNKKYRTRRRTISAPITTYKENILSTTTIPYNKRKLSLIPLPDLAAEMRQLSIQAILFLNTRPMDAKYGNLLTALENGKILVWSHHPFGGFKEQFNAIHMAGDSVCAMSTDETNTYLFTGSVMGYVKIWLMTNYCVPENVKKHISTPLMRLEFPFMIRTVFLGRAKRSVRAQKLPILLSSYKAHRKPISCLVYIDRNKILLTASSDKSVRLWSLGGQYLATLGSPLLWNYINPNRPLDIFSLKNDDQRIPPDIKRDASFTTLHVLTNGQPHLIFKKKVDMTENNSQDEKLEQKEKHKCIYGKSLKDPILTTDYGFSEAIYIPSELQLNASLPYIPIYSNLKVQQITQDFLKK